MQGRSRARMWSPQSLALRPPSIIISTIGIHTTVTAPPRRISSLLEHAQCIARRSPRRTPLQPQHTTQQAAAGPSTQQVRPTGLGRGRRHRMHSRSPSLLCRRAPCPTHSSPHPLRTAAGTMGVPKPKSKSGKKKPARPPQQVRRCRRRALGVACRHACSMHAAALLSMHACRRGCARLMMSMHALPSCHLLRSACRPGGPGLAAQQRMGLPMHYPTSPLPLAPPPSCLTCLLPSS